MKSVNLNTVINYRGARQQAFEFAVCKKGYMKQCYCKGAEIFTPLSHNLKGVDMSSEMVYLQIMSREIELNEPIKFTF